MRHLNNIEAERQVKPASSSSSAFEAASSWAVQQHARSVQQAQGIPQGITQERYPYNPTVAPVRLPKKRPVEVDLYSVDHPRVTSHSSYAQFYTDGSRVDSYRSYPSESHSLKSPTLQSPWEPEGGYEGTRGREVWSGRGRSVHPMEHSGSEDQLIARRSLSYDVDSYRPNLVVQPPSKVRHPSHASRHSSHASSGNSSPAPVSYSIPRDLDERNHDRLERQHQADPSIKQEWTEDLTPHQFTEAPPTTTPFLGLDSVPPTPESCVGSETDGGAGLRLVPLDECMPTTAKPPPTAGDIELCLICGDRASGFHYNALSCEGCKGFFRRSVTRSATYACKYGGRCEMDMWMRRRCQACRLRRCQDVGMREECLLSERQCSARNARRQYRKQSAEKAAAAAVSPAAVPPPTAAAPAAPPQRTKRSSSSSGGVVRDKKDHVTGLGVVLNPERGVEEECLLPCGRLPMENVLGRLCDEHKAVIRCLVAYQDKYELPSEADLSKVSEVKVNEEDEPVDSTDVLFMHMVEMTILVTRLVINFAKSLPGFLSLHKHDQIILLKGSASEVMMLRTSRRYDPQTDTVVFGNGQPFTANAMEFGGLQGHIDSMFEFSRGMSKLFVDDVEYALLTALTIFSVRAGLKEQAAVEQIQDIYLEVLLAYLSQSRAGSRSFVARFLMKLVELRSLSAEHAQVLRNLKLERKSLPPLLSEYFDISD